MPCHVTRSRSVVVIDRDGRRRAAQRHVRAAVELVALPVECRHAHRSGRRLRQRRSQAKCVAHRVVGGYQPAGHAHVAVLHVRRQPRIAEQRQHQPDDGDQPDAGDEEEQDRRWPAAARLRKSCRRTCVDCRGCRGVGASGGRGATSLRSSQALLLIERLVGVFEQLVDAPRAVGLEAGDADAERQAIATRLVDVVVALQLLVEPADQDRRRSRPPPRWETP